jgi:hypothetical protein
MQFVPPREAHPAVYFAGWRSVISVKLFAQPMKVVLSESFCFVQQCVDNFASGGGVVEILDVAGDDPEV